MAEKLAAIVRPDDRNIYRPSGRINGVIFLPLAVLALAVAVLMAVALAYLGIWGWHIILLAPILLVAPAALALGGAVRLGHCRNPRLAVALGVVVGLIVGVGHYHAQLVIRTGPAFLTRVDLLPEWINFQMEHQVITKIGHDNARNKDGPGVVDIIFNWFFLACEVVICVVIGGGLGSLAATRVYDESRGQWAVPSKWQLHWGAGRMLAVALANRSREGMEEALAYTDFNKTDGYAKLEFYRTATVNDFGEWEERRYLTITQYAPKVKNSAQAPSELIGKWELFPDEVDIIEKHIPGSQFPESGERGVSTP